MTSVVSFAPRLWLKRLAPRRPSRMLSLFGAAVIAATVALTSLSLWQLRAGAIAEAKHLVANIGSVLAGQTARTLTDIDLALATLVEQHRLLPFEDAFDGPAAARQMQAMAISLPRVRVEIADAKGIVLHGFGAGGTSPQSIADRDYFAMSRDGRIGPFLGLVNGTGGDSRAVVLSRSLSDADARFAGVVAAIVDSAAFIEFYRSIQLGEGIAIALLLESGDLLARYPELPAGAGGVNPAIPFDGAGPNQDGEWPGGEIGDVPRVGIATPVPGYPLIVAVSVTEAVALDGWRSQATTIAFSSLAAATMLGFLLLLLIRQSARHDALIEETRSAKEQAEAAMQRAEAASRVRNRFLANMSHELRTPLNAIIGFSEIIRDQLAGPLSDKYVGYALDINTSGNHLLVLINEILDLSKVEAGRFELRQDIVDLTGVVESCMKLVDQAAQRMGVQLHRDIESTLLMRADPVRVKQIVINLLSNAVKFTPAAGRVTVGALRRGDGCTVITVADTGIGMTEDEIIVAMQPFRQLDHHLSKRHPGTGLGLPLAKALAELHEGQLLIRSARGAGTTVTVVFPAVRAIPGGSAQA